MQSRPRTSSGAFRGAPLGPSGQGKGTLQRTRDILGTAVSEYSVRGVVSLFFFQKLRAVLGERTEMSAILREIEGYDKLLEEKENGEPLIDAIIHTTSEKQSVAQILKTYGIEMNWVWEDLKSRSSRGHPTTNQPKKYI